MHVQFLCSETTNKLFNILTLTLSVSLIPITILLWLPSTNNYINTTVSIYVWSMVVGSTTFGLAPVQTHSRSYFTLSPLASITSYSEKVMDEVLYTYKFSRDVNFAVFEVNLSFMKF